MDEVEGRREVAVKRVKAKRDFKNHAAIYVIVNGMLVGIWAFSGMGSFWPIWPLLGWGIGLAFNAWAVYFERPITEAEIQSEIEKGT
jgi:2TM domain